MQSQDDTESARPSCTKICELYRIWERFEVNYTKSPVLGERLLQAL